MAKVGLLDSCEKAPRHRIRADPWRVYMRVEQFGDAELPSFVTRRTRMWTKADGDSSVRWGDRFDPFHDPYLADPYPFFAEVRAATPVFYTVTLSVLIW